ncbi:MAG: 3-hydroxyacyl-CoA dehydrogenase family protein [Burkholderiales bacterium]
MKGERRAIKTVGVAGSGTMGAGIAIVAARAGFRTIVFDPNEAALDRARTQTQGFFAKSVERKKLSQGEVDAILSAMSATTEIKALAECDIVLEAVFENLAVKHALFDALDKICPPYTLFASNTSTLSITEIAAGSHRDDRFVGMHFCLPAQLMKLVETSPGLKTSEDSFQAAWDFCIAMGQIPVRTKDNPGFILNYFLVPFNNDAIRLVEAGVAAPADIDRAIKSALGYPMGPLELIDLVGLDTHLLVAEALYASTHEPRAAAPALVKRMIAAGQLGRKTGQGFYAYKGGAMFGG